MKITCPCCGSEYVESVSSVIAKGTFEYTVPTPAKGEIGGHTFYGTVNVTGTSMSNLVIALKKTGKESYWTEISKGNQKAAMDRYRQEHPMQRSGLSYRLQQVLLWLSIIGIAVAVLAAVASSYSLMVFAGLAAVICYVAVIFIAKSDPPEVKKWKQGLANAMYDGNEGLERLKKSAMTG
jgi:hypothetical protein